MLEALTMPLNEKVAMDELLATPIANNTNDSPPTPSSSSRNDSFPVLEHALDMLVNVLRNVDNLVNLPIELRANTCTFFLQLQKHISSDSLAPIREIVLPVLQQIVEDSTQEEEKLTKVANLLIASWTNPRP